MLSGGITQQPHPSRFPNQFESATNCLFSVFDGLSKRAGTYWDRRIDNSVAVLTIGQQHQVHPIIRDDREHYRVLVSRHTGSGLIRVRVFERGGPEATVSYASGQQVAIETYLASNNAVGRDLRLRTIADGTLIGNSKAVTGLLTSPNYSLDRTHKDTDVMVNTTPTQGTYHRGLADGVDLKAGYYQFDQGSDGRTFPTYQNGSQHMAYSGWVSLQGTGNEWTRTGSNAVRLGFRRFPITLAGAAVTLVSGVTFTVISAGAFATYTREDGDALRCTGGTAATFPGGLTEGWATIISKDSNDQITVQCAATGPVYSAGRSVSLAAGNLNASGIGREYELSVNLQSKINAGTIADMDDLAAALTQGLRDAGETDALIGWVPAASGAGGTFRLTGPWKGSNAIIYPPLPPTTGAGGAGDMSIDDRPFSNTSGEYTIVAGTSPGPGDATATRMPITQRWTKKAPPNQPQWRPDPEKMPVLLKRLTFTGDGTTPATFQLEQVNWNERESGDELTNKAPRLLTEARPITDIAFHEQRVAFSGGPYALCTAAGDLFRVFKEEDINQVDSDPVEIEVGESAVPTILRMTSQARVLVCTSDAGVAYELAADGPWTPTSVGVTPGASYDLLNVAPVVMDGRLYMAARRAAGPGERTSAQVIEYDFDDLRAKSAGFDITSHTPILIDENIIRMAAVPGDGLVAVLTTEPRELWFYQTYFANGNQRQQSAWSRMEYPAGDRICDICTTREGLVLLVETTAGEIVFERLRFEKDYTSQAIVAGGTYPFPVRMDRMMELTGVHAAGTTTWTIPFADNSITRAVKRDGTILTLARPTSTTATASGDHSALPCMLGRNFRMTGRFSRFFLETQNMVRAVRQKLLLTKLTFHFRRTGKFTIHIEREGGEPVTVHTMESPAGMSEQGEKTVFGCGFAHKMGLEVQSEDPRPVNIPTAQLEGEVADLFPVGY